jgi:hypothetical protein
MNQEIINTIMYQMNLHLDNTPSSAMMTFELSNKF